MEFKTILVDMTEDDAREARLDTALILATWFGGRVAGVTATGPLLDPYRSAGEAALRYQAMRADMLRRLDAAGTEALNRALMRHRTKVEAFHRVVGQEAGWVLAAEGLTSDIVLPGLPGASPELPALLASAAEYALVNAGRPILVVPPSARLDPLHTAVVAWNGRREAARAVADALPLLRRAKRVIVHVVLTRSGAGGHVAGEQEASALVQWLTTHDVRASLRFDEASSAAECLIGRVLVDDAGLLVAGGYGHSRLGELFLGGTTRTLLQNSPVPLLMSH